jgi:hypothetical protein
MLQIKNGDFRASAKPFAKYRSANAARAIERAVFGLIYSGLEFSTSSWCPNGDSKERDVTAMGVS